MEEQQNKRFDDQAEETTPENVNQAYKLQEYMNQAKEQKEESFVRPEAKDIMAIFNEIESHESETSAGSAAVLEAVAPEKVENGSGLHELHQTILNMKPKEVVAFEDFEESYGIDPAEHQETIEAMCLSKKEEFDMLGYEHVTIDEIWQCVSSKYKKGTPALHQVVNDILSLRVTQFMNWVTMNSVYMRK